MSTAESEDAYPAATRPRNTGRRPLGRILLTLLTQYVIVATVVGLSIAATLHHVVTPKVVAQFEAIEAAFRRLPAR